MVYEIAGNPVDVPAFRYAGGAQALTDALAAKVSDLRLDSPVRQIHATADALLVHAAACPARHSRDPTALVATGIAISPTLPA